MHEVTSDHLHRILAQPYWATSIGGLYRPLTTLSYLFNYAVLGNGTNPSGYHIFNLLLHIANICLIYALGMLLFEDTAVIVLMTALWAVHPVLTESVTNVVGRADLLSTFGILAAVIACHKVAGASSRRRSSWWLIVVVIAASIAVSSKESGIAVIAAVVFYDFIANRHQPLRQRLPSYAAVLLPCTVFLIARARVLSNAVTVPIPFVDNPLVGADFWTSRLTAFGVVQKYLALLVMPSSLSFDYSFNAVPLFGWNLSHWEDDQVVLGILACLVLVGIAIWYRSHKAVLFLAAFSAAAFAPTSNVLLLVGTIMAERFLYLPSVGLIALAVLALHWLWLRLPVAHPSRAATLAMVGVLLLALAARTHARNADWLDTNRFWQSGLEAAPESYKVQLGVATNSPLRSGQDWDRSIYHAECSLSILDPLPDDENLGRAYRIAGGFFRAVGDHIASPAAARTTLTGNDPVFWYRKSLQVLRRSERIELLQDERNRQINARIGKPGLTFLPAELYREMGRTYARLGDTPQALQALERGRALESDPDLLEELSKQYRNVGDFRSAARALVEAVAVDGTRGRLMDRIVDLYRAADPAGCSVNLHGEAAELNLSCPAVHGDLCVASRNVIRTYLKHGQSTEATAIRRVALSDLGCSPDSLE